MMSSVTTDGKSDADNDEHIVVDEVHNSEFKGFKLLTLCGRHFLQHEFTIYCLKDLVLTITSKTNCKSK